jgi:carboxyvinyl-carboxyphosphonate phosphorylmutase
VEGTAGAVKRAKAFAATGVDAVFVVGVESADQVMAVHEAAKLPVMVGSAPAAIRREEFAAAGARVLLQGHQPLPAAVKALKEVYTHLYNGGAPADLKDKIASAKEMDTLVSGEAYKKWQREYLR